MRAQTKLHKDEVFEITFDYLDENVLIHHKTRNAPESYYHA